jgi:hypothetical protein
VEARILEYHKFGALLSTVESLDVFWIVLAYISLYVVLKRQKIVLIIENPFKTNKPSHYFVMAYFIVFL